MSTWHFHKDGDRKGHITRGINGPIVAVIPSVANGFSVGERLAEDLADGCKLAAAPDLLAACKKAMNLVESDAIRDSQAMVMLADMLEDATALAEGQSK